MKRGTRQHPKFKALCAALGIPEYAGVGLLESLWMTVEEFQDDGAIGRWSDHRIAGAIGWDRDPGQLVMFLIECELVDEVAKPDRLVVHDWLSHCSSHVWDRVKKRVQRARASGAGKALPPDGKASTFPLVVPWLGAMVDKASAERSRNGSVEHASSSGGDPARGSGPDPGGPPGKCPAASGSVGQRPAAGGSSDPNPRPKTHDLKPKTSPTTVVVVGAAGSPVENDIGDFVAASGTTTTTKGTEIGDAKPEKTGDPGTVSLAEVPCTDRSFPVDQGLVDRLQADFPELYVLGDIHLLCGHLRAHPQKQRPNAQALDSIQRWLMHAQRTPALRAQRPAPTAGRGVRASGESAMDRRRREVAQALRGKLVLQATEGS